MKGVEVTCLVPFLQKGNRVDFSQPLEFSDSQTPFSLDYSQIRQIPGPKGTFLQYGHAARIRVFLDHSAGRCSNAPHLLQGGPRHIHFGKICVLEVRTCQIRSVEVCPR